MLNNFEQSDMGSEWIMKSNEISIFC